MIDIVFFIRLRMKLNLRKNLVRRVNFPADFRHKRCLCNAIAMIKTPQNYRKISF